MCDCVCVMHVCVCVYLCVRVCTRAYMHARVSVHVIVHARVCALFTNNSVNSITVSPNQEGRSQHNDQEKTLLFI